MSGEYGNTPVIWHDLLELLHLEIQKNLTKNYFIYFVIPVQQYTLTPYIVYSIFLPL